MRKSAFFPDGRKTYRERRESPKRHGILRREPPPLPPSKQPKVRFFRPRIRARLPRPAETACGLGAAGFAAGAFFAARAKNFPITEVISDSNISTTSTTVNPTAENIIICSKFGCAGINVAMVYINLPFYIKEECCRVSWACASGVCRASPSARGRLFRGFRRVRLRR